MAPPDRVVLFVRAASPGSVLRLAERWGRGDGAPETLLLSDAVAPAGWRALIVPPERLAWAEGFAPRLAAAFPPDVFLLARVGARVRRGRFPAEGEAEVADEAAAPVGRWPIPRARRGPSPETAWAQERGLPLDRANAPRQVEYETIASLDRRSLLIEDSPRLYRFRLGGQ